MVVRQAVFGGLHPIRSRPIFPRPFLLTQTRLPRASDRFVICEMTLTSHLAALKTLFEITDSHVGGSVHDPFPGKSSARAVVLFDGPARANFAGRAPSAARLLSLPSKAFRGEQTLREAIRPLLTG